MIVQRGAAFSASEDIEIVRGRASRLTFAEISQRMANRSKRSIEGRYLKLCANGDAHLIRQKLIDAVAV